MSQKMVLFLNGLKRKGRGACYLTSERKVSMFDRLDTIDWSRLKTAYGTAEAIPGVLRDLASPAEEVRGAAWQTLRSELEHQGTVYQASAYATPFLVAWLPEAQGEEKRGLVAFLALLAQGNSYKRQNLNLTDE